MSKVWTGTEEEIYHIKTDSGKEILATGEHQFRTDDGYVRVLDLTSSTRLMTDEGGTMRAVYCYAQAYQDTVYSLDLEDGDSFFAAGFVSGTMERQNMVCRSGKICRRNSKNWTDRSGRERFSGRKVCRGTNTVKFP